MNHPSRKVTTPPPKKNAINARITKPVVKKPVKKSAKKSQNKLQKSKKYLRQKWLNSLLAIAILFAATGLVGGFAWLSFMYIFQPQQITWINRMLPSWAQVPWQGVRPQTLTEISYSLKSQGEIAGKLINLGEDTDGKFLLPIYTERPSCKTDCRQISELRIYQVSTDAEFQGKREKYYYLISQTGVAGPEEAFVVAPLANATNENPGTNINLPLTGIERFDPNSAPPGFWFYLHGTRLDGVHNFSYGQVFYYTPERDRILQKLTWTSPYGIIPQWQEITGEGEKELIVNQSVGLEPQIRAFQVKMAKSSAYPTGLEEILLQPSGWKNKAFSDALQVAKSGLWTPADKWLQFIEKQHRKKIPPRAQAQMAIVRLHAQQTKIQADNNWASPGQEALADLIDGRWSQALSVLENSATNAGEVSRLLKADGGRLWSRVETALKINSSRSEVQIWATLILAAQSGEKRANAWLQSQKNVTDQTRKDAQIWLRRLRGEVVGGSLTTTNTPHPSRIIGSVQPIDKINAADWLNFDPSLNLTPNNSTKWYKVTVSDFHNGKSWLATPFTGLNLPSQKPEKFLASQLGLETDATMQITRWHQNGEQIAVSTTIRAARLRNGKLELLTVADDLNSNRISDRTSKTPPIALSTSALEWLQPSPITLLDLIQTNPQRGQKLLEVLWRELQASGQIQGGKMPKLAEFSQKAGHWPLQNPDINGNNQPEIMLTVSREAIAALATPKSVTKTNPIPPKTLIISDTGKVFYSDFRIRNQRITAIATLGGTNIYALLVEGNNGYSLKRWSPQNQRFD